MSYIRCLSNPEGLYIWPDISGDVMIAGGPDVAPGITEPEQWRSMPNELWDKLLETWVRSWYEDVAIIEVIDGVKHEVSLIEVCKSHNEETGEGGRRSVKIEYKNDEGKSWELDNIWPVTMHYIASRYENPYYSAGWFKRQMLRLLGV